MGGGEGPHLLNVVLESVQSDIQRFLFTGCRSSRR